MLGQLGRDAAPSLNHLHNQEVDLRATLHASICIVLAGVVVGLISPEGSLLSAMRGLFGWAHTSEATPLAEPIAAASDAVVEAAPVASDAPEAEIAADANALDVGYAPLQQQTAARPPAKAAGGECAVLTEAARQGYLSAGYATQDFASASIIATQDKTTQTAVRAARDRYQTALKSANDQIAAASRAQ